MNVCTYGFLYQDQFTISNSAKTVRVITFHVPPEAGNMLQVLPKTGYVQAESSLTAQEGFQIFTSHWLIRLNTCSDWLRD